MEADTLSVPQVQSMQQSDASQDLTIGGIGYEFSVHRVPADSLSTVTTESGEKFRNNLITLIIKNKSTGTEVLHRTFDKSYFASVIADDDFLARSILLGIVFDQTDEGSMRFIASVGDPIDEELFVPMVMTVSTDGSISLSKSQSLDSMPEDEQQQNSGLEE